MTDNPYAPPNSHVEDIALPQAHMERPRQVVTAILLALVNYVLGLVVIIASWSYYSTLQSIGSAISQQLFSLVLFVWINYKIYLGRNWARVTLLVFNALGFLMALSSAVRSLLMTLPTIAKLQMVVGTGVSLWILWLLFISPGRSWFRRGTN